jgi:hypothetical protein
LSLLEFPPGSSKASLAEEKPGGVRSQYSPECLA